VYNQSHSDIVAHSTFTTSVFESNSSRPTSFTSPNSTNFSPEEVALLGKLQIPNVLQFFTSFYWAVQLDLGQSDPQNIFLDKSLLSSATRVFHNNDFIGNVYQNTPLTDNTIPGDGFPNAQGSVAPLSQTDAFIAVEYQCSRQTGKSALLALIDVIVPSVVLFVLICVILYALGWCIWGNITGNSHYDYAND
jgi:hypothetical protein